MLEFSATVHPRTAIRRVFIRFMINPQGDRQCVGSRRKIARFRPYLYKTPPALRSEAEILGVTANVTDIDDRDRQQTISSTKPIIISRTQSYYTIAQKSNCNVSIALP